MSDELTISFDDCAITPENLATLPPCHCGRGLYKFGCLGCSLHPFDCSCLPIPDDDLFPEYPADWRKGMF